MELIKAMLSELNLTKFSLLANPILSTTLVGISIYFLRTNISAIKNQNENAIRSERNERFKNAIDQLGSEKNVTVLGGIYTLHRIAKEDESYRENVFNILCSFVRDVTITGEYQAKYTEKPSEPIQTILNILCKNKDDFNIYKTPTKKRNIITRTSLYKFYESLRTLKNKFLLDFSSAYLVGANLENANLSEATLTGTNLSKANLTKADLIKADLLKANLADASLKDAYLIYTNLLNANLIGAGLWSANLTGAILLDANLTGGYLWNANLRDAHLVNADLRGADLTLTNLAGTKLGGAYLEGVTSLTDLINFHKLFEKHIIASIGKLTDLSGIKGYAKNNKPYTGDPITGKYTEEEAKQMIEDYKNNLK